jgi:hypothetical protein
MRQLHLSDIEIWFATSFIATIFFFPSQLMTFLKSANVQTIAPSVRSAFVDLCRETNASLLNAAMSSRIAGDPTESISLDHASDAVHALVDAHTAEMLNAE